MNIIQAHWPKSPDIFPSFSFPKRLDTSFFFSQLNNNYFLFTRLNQLQLSDSETTKITKTATNPEFITSSSHFSQDLNLNIGFLQQFRFDFFFLPISSVFSQEPVVQNLQNQAQFLFFFFPFSPKCKYQNFLNNLPSFFCFVLFSPKLISQKDFWTARPFASFCNIQEQAFWPNHFWELKQLSIAISLTGQATEISSFNQKNDWQFISQRYLNLAFAERNSENFFFIPVTSVFARFPLSFSVENKFRFWSLFSLYEKQPLYSFLEQSLAKFSFSIFADKESSSRLIFLSFPFATRLFPLPLTIVPENFSQLKQPISFIDWKRTKKVQKRKKTPYWPPKFSFTRFLNISFFQKVEENFFFAPATSIFRSRPNYVTKNNFVQFSFSSFFPSPKNKYQNFLNNLPFFFCFLLFSLKLISKKDFWTTRPFASFGNIEEQAFRPNHFWELKQLSIAISLTDRATEISSFNQKNDWQFVNQRYLNLAFAERNSENFFFIPVTSVFARFPLSFSVENKFRFWSLFSLYEKQPLYSFLEQSLAKFSFSIFADKESSSRLIFLSLPLATRLCSFPPTIVPENFSQLKQPISFIDWKRAKDGQKRKRTAYWPANLSSARFLNISFFQKAEENFFFAPATSVLHFRPNYVTKNNFVQFLFFDLFLFFFLPNFYDNLFTNLNLYSKFFQSSSVLDFRSLPKMLENFPILPVEFHKKRQTKLTDFKKKAISTAHISRSKIVWGSESPHRLSLNISFWNQIENNFYFVPVISILSLHPSGVAKNGEALFIEFCPFLNLQNLYLHFASTLRYMKVFFQPKTEITFRQLAFASQIKNYNRIFLQMPFYQLQKFSVVKSLPPTKPKTFWSILKNPLFWLQPKEKKVLSYKILNLPELYDEEIFDYNQFIWTQKRYANLQIEQKRLQKQNTQILLTLLNPKPEKYALELSKVSKYYLTGRKINRIFHKVDLKIKHGDFVVILGPSGSGKTTLLNIMAGLDGADSGDVVAMGENLTLMNEGQLTEFRRSHVGVIFQSYNLLQNLTARENVEIGAFLTPPDKKPISIKEIMKDLEIERYSNSYSYQLSGGQQQRFSIARALVKNPDLLFCDEPTGALDQKMSRKVLKTLFTVQQKYKTTIVLITHNEQFAKIANTVIRFKDGEIMKIDTNKNRIPVNRLEI